MQEPQDLPDFTSGCSIRKSIDIKKGQHYVDLLFEPPVGISPSRFYIGMLCPKSKSIKKGQLIVDLLFEPPVGIEPTTRQP